MQDLKIRFDISTSGFNNLIIFRSNLQSLHRSRIRRFRYKKVTTKCHSFILTPHNKLSPTPHTCSQHIWKIIFHLEEPLLIAFSANSSTLLVVNCRTILYWPLAICSEISKPGSIKVKLRYMLWNLVFRPMPEALGRENRLVSSWKYGKVGPLG